MQDERKNPMCGILIDYSTAGGQGQGGIFTNDLSLDIEHLSLKTCLQAKLLNDQC
jgi:hypothetical protein